jgi:hypothetical protein
MSGAGMDVRWAVRGKVPGQFDDYKILEDDSGGERQSEYAVLVKQLVTSNPRDPQVAELDRLPWVTVGVVEATGGAWRTALVISEWPEQEVRDHTGRIAFVSRYFDVDWAEQFQRKVTYVDLFDALVEQRPAGRTGLRCEPAPPDLRAVAATIDAFGARWLASAAAALLEGPVMLRPDQGLDTLRERLACLDAVAALLPYGYRATLTASSWTPNDSEHAIRLAFSDRPVAGRRLLRRDQQVVELIAPEARNYADRLVRQLDRLGTEPVLRHLWADDTSCNLDSADRALESLAALDRTYAVYQDLRRGLASVRDVVATLSRPEVDLARADPEHVTGLVREVLDKGADVDLQVLDRHWARSQQLRDEVFAAALSTDRVERLRALWEVAAQGGDKAVFPVYLAQHVTAERRAMVARLLATADEEAWSVELIETLLTNQRLTAMVLLEAHRTNAPATLRWWADALFSGPPLPLWAEPFPIMRSGSAQVHKDHIVLWEGEGKRTMLALLAVTAAAGSAEVFLTCRITWTTLFNQLMRADREIFDWYESINRVLPPLSPRGQAAADVLWLAGHPSLLYPPHRDTPPANLGDYYDEVRRKLEQNPHVDRIAARFAESVGTTVLTVEDVDFLFRIAAILPPASQVVLHRTIADKAAHNTSALQRRPPHEITLLCGLSENLNRAFVRERLVLLAGQQASVQDMTTACIAAQHQGVPVAEVLTHAANWRGLDDPAIAYRLVLSMYEARQRTAPDAPDVGYGLVNGVIAILDNLHYRDRGRRLAAWIPAFVDEQKRAIDAQRAQLDRQKDWLDNLGRTVKKHKTPKPERRSGKPAEHLPQTQGATS